MMRAFFASLLVALMIVSGAGAARAYTVPPLPKPQLIAVYFWASWCPNCKVLTPLVEQARKDGALDAQDVLFVKMDLSDAASIHQSLLLAAQLGIGGYVQAQGSATGYVALLKPDGKTEITRFDRTGTADSIRTGIEKALPPAKPKG